MFAVAKITSSSTARNILVVKYPYKWDEVVIQNPEVIDAEML